MDVDDLYRALEAFPEQERMIRQKIWWASNDRIRNQLGERHYFAPDEQEELRKLLDDRYDENCAALLKLFNPEDENQRITMAELYRNLGEFDKCIELINSIEADGDDMVNIKTASFTNVNWSTGFYFA